MKEKLWLMAALLMVLMTGCLKDDLQGTIVLMGTESDVKSIEEVIPDTLLSFVADTTEMEGEVLELHEGITPPDIQGEYMFFPRELYADNGHHPEANDTLFFRFGGDGDTLGYYPEGQHNRCMPVDILEKGFSQKHVDKAYVMGNGSDFTAYFTVPYDDCFESMSGIYFTLTRGYVIKGTVSDTGIDDVVMACVNISAEPNNPSDYVPDDAFRLMLNRIYIYRVNTGNTSDPFGSAVRQQWYGINP